MRAGRPIKTYTASYDPTVRVPGLSRGKDGRWRVFAHGKETRFTEADERKAVGRALAALGDDRFPTTEVVVTLGDNNYLTGSVADIASAGGSHTEAGTVTTSPPPARSRPPSPSAKPGCAQPSPRKRRHHRAHRR